MLAKPSPMIRNALNYKYMSSKSLRKAEPPAKDRSKHIPAWQFEHAAWVARQPTKPTKREQIEKAEELAQKTITDYAFRKFTSQELYIKTLLKYQLDHVVRVKDTIMRRLDKYADRFDWAVDEAREMGDYKTVGQLAIKPIESMVWNKHQQEPGRVAVNIQISEARIAGMDVDVPEVEFEEITEDAEEDY